MSSIDRARLDVETVARAPERMEAIRSTLVAELGYEPRMPAIRADIARSMLPPSVERAHEELTRLLSEAEPAAKRASAAIYTEETATAGDRAAAHRLRDELEAAEARLVPAFNRAVGYEARR